MRRTGVLGRELDVCAGIGSKLHHLRHLFDALRSRDLQLDVQVQVRGREERVDAVELGVPAPHKGFSDLYEKMSGKGESASEAHRRSR